MPTNIPLDGHVKDVLGMPNPKFSKYSDDDVEEEIQHWESFRDLPLKDPTAVLKRIEALEQEKLVRERTKEWTGFGERLSISQKPNGLGSRDKGKGPITQIPPNTEGFTGNGWRGSSSASLGSLAVPPPQPGLQSSSKLLCRLCERSNSDYICFRCRSAPKLDKLAQAARKRTLASSEEKPAPCKHRARTDYSERECKRLLTEKDLVKAFPQENEDNWRQKIEETPEETLQKIKKRMEDALQKTITSIWKVHVKDSGMECVVCFKEFGDDPSRQRAHYTDCNHANTCFGCAMKMWNRGENRGKNNCPCCKTPATLFPLRLPAKIFL